MSALPDLNITDVDWLQRNDTNVDWLQREDNATVTVNSSAITTTEWVTTAAMLVNLTAGNGTTVPITPNTTECLTASCAANLDDGEIAISKEMYKYI